MNSYSMPVDVIGWLFIIYCLCTFGAFIIAIALLIASLDGIDRSAIPVNLRFNPLNALLSPKALTDKGRLLKAKGLRWFRIYLFLLVSGMVAWLVLLGIEKIIR